MTKYAWLAALSLSLFALACGGEGDDDGGGSGGDSTSSGNSTSSGSSTTCSSEHECINDVCECKTPGKEGQSCASPSACESDCEVCS